MKPVALLGLAFGVLAGSIGAMAESAEALLRQRRLPEAQQAFEERIRTRPDDAEAHHQLGRLALARQEYEAAMPALEKAVSLEPEEPGYQFHYGAACLQHADQLGMTLRALSLGRRGRNAMVRAVELAPDNVEFRQGLIEFYLRAPSIVGGSVEKARDQAEALRRIQPREGAIALASVHLRTKEPEAAFALYAEWLDRAPDDFQVLYLTGRASADTGLHPERGVSSLRRCLELTPPPRAVGHATVHFHSGRILQQQGDFDGARAAYRAALALEPAHGPAQASLEALPP